jgi:putative MATE family efflux protein
MMLATLSNTTISLVDTAVVGRRGLDDLAAASIAATITTVVIELLLAATVAYQVQASGLLGAGDRGGARILLRNATLLFVGLAAAGAAALAVFAPTWAARFSADAAVVGSVVEFLRVRALGIPILAVATLLRMTLDADRVPRFGLHAALLANAVNIALAPLLVSRIGIAGSAWAADAANVVTLAYFVFRFRGRLPGGSTWRPSLETLRALARVGWPETVNVGILYVASLTLLGITAKFGASALAAGRIGQVLGTVCFALAAAFTSGLQVLIARELGGGNTRAAGDLFRSGRRLATVALAAAGFGVYLSRDLVLAIFSGSWSGDIDGARWAITTTAIALPFIGAAAAHTALLRAQRRTKQVLWVSIASTWAVMLPVAWLLGLQLDLGAAGVYAGYTAHMAARAGLSLLLVGRGERVS